MPLAARPWLLAVLFAVLVFLPSLAHAQMTYETVDKFMQEKEWAEKGDRMAQFKLGIYYYNNQGVAKDYVQAVSWWRKAIDQGVDEALSWMGNCYHNGDGVKKDIIEAYAYWKIAGAFNEYARDNLAKLEKKMSWDDRYLGQLRAKKLKEEIEARRVAVLLGSTALSPAHAGMTDVEVKKFMQDKALAEKGDRAAQFNLGNSYAKGEGVAKDFVQAVTWYRKAAERGLAEAQTGMGYCYANGLGVAKDEVQALSWYRKAAEQGYAQAQSNLGVCYAKGEGVTKNLIEAYAYWNLAGITHESARENLAILEKKMSRDEIASGQQRTKQLQKEIEAKQAGK